MDVGDLVTFESRVLHARSCGADQSSQPASVQRRHTVFVEVQARVNRPEHATTAVTNRFTLTCAYVLLQHEADAFTVHVVGVSDLGCLCASLQCARWWLAVRCDSFQHAQCHHVCEE